MSWVMLPRPGGQAKAPTLTPVLAGLLLGCAGPRAPARESALGSTTSAADGAHAPSAAAETALPVERPLAPGGSHDGSSAPGSSGRELDLPWWSSLSPGVYLLRDSLRPAEGSSSRPWRLAVGISAGHHHASEGLLRAKVSARLGLRALAGSGPSNLEPELIDVFVTRERRVYVLYGLAVTAPDSAISSATDVGPPPELVAPGRRRAGRHAYDGARHLYLECDVEGPLANPEWGATRVSAQLDRSLP